MSKTVFETRGHMLYMQYLAHVSFIRHHFLFSIGRRFPEGIRVKYYWFFENSTFEQKDVEVLKAGTLLLARGDGCIPGSLTIREPRDVTDLIPKANIAWFYVSPPKGKGDPVFAKVDVMGKGKRGDTVIAGFRMRHVNTSIAPLEAVAGTVHVDDREFMIGDPCKLPPKIDHFKDASPMPT